MTMPTRRNAARLLALTLALGLISWRVALACGPSAPNGQAGGTVETTPTPTATEAAPVDTPTPELMPTDEPTEAPTPEPTPTLFMIDNGVPKVVDAPVPQKYPNLDSSLYYLVLEREEAQSSPQGASGQTTQQVAEVDVLITLDSGESTPAVVQFLKDNNASPLFDYMNLPNDGYGYDTSLGAILPVSLLVRLSQLPGVLRVEEPDRPDPDNNSNSPSSQGARNPADAHGARTWHNAGYEGTGIAVGVIDSGFAKFSTLVKPTIVPNGGEVKSLCFPATGTRTPMETDISVCENELPNKYHGVSTSQAVLTTAPNVSLYIANPDNLNRLRYTVDWMIRKGVKIINVSLGCRGDGPGDGSSPFQSPQTLLPSPLDTLNDAVRRDAVWVNAAGNRARLT